MQEIIRGAEMQDARHDIHVRACDLGPGAPLSAGKRLPAAPFCIPYFRGDLSESGVQAPVLPLVLEKGQAVETAELAIPEELQGREERHHIRLSYFIRSET